MMESTKEQHHLTMQSSLLSLHVSFTIAEKKLQIINIQCQSLILPFQNEHFEHGLVITGSDQNLNEVQN